MKYSNFLPLVAAAATAFVIPDEAMAKQLVLEPKSSPIHEVSWWDSFSTSLDDLRDSVKDTLTSTSEAFDDAVQSVSSSLSDFEIDAVDFLPSWSEAEPCEEHHHHDDRPDKGRRRPGRGGHRTKLTLYQAIHESKYTTKIAALVDKYPDIVATLNSTSGGNLTFFVPTNRAFEKIPDHPEHPPPREFVEKLLLYHVVPGLYPAGRVLASHTLPTALKEERLGGNSQRLRVSLSVFGLRVNFYSKVIAANIFTSNGVIHAVDSLLVPPPPTGKIIELFPAKFSTFILAVEKTDVLADVRGQKTYGGTVFAPTNRAFQKLGPATNAFLFNTEKGIGYLKALLKYHLVANETLYSDAYYGRKQYGNGDSGSQSDIDAEAARYHVDLPTLLGDRSISVDVARYGGFILVKLNGFVTVSITDVVAKDAAIHVVDSVLIPPRKPGQKGSSTYEDGSEIDVEELIERLNPYVGNGKDWSVGEL